MNGIFAEVTDYFGVTKEIFARLKEKIAKQSPCFAIFSDTFAKNSVTFPNISFVRANISNQIPEKPDTPAGKSSLPSTACGSPGREYLKKMEESDNIRVLCLTLHDLKHLSDRFR